jgi:low temperature requirement protein LtrA
LFIIAQMFAVAAMAVTIHEVFSRGSAGFALFYAAVRFILVGEYMGADVFVPSAHKFIRRLEISFGNCRRHLADFSLRSPPYRFVLWGLGMLVDLAPRSAPTACTPNWLPMLFTCPSGLPSSPSWSWENPLPA